MLLSEKGPKGRFFASDKLDNHTIEGKGKNKQIERAKRKKGGGKKKAMVAPIVLTFSTLEIVFWQKKCLAEEVYLAETFSKMQYGKKKTCYLQRRYIYLLQLLLESRMRKRLLECSCDNGFLLLINLNF